MGMKEVDSSLEQNQEETTTIRVRRNVYKQKSFDDEFQLGKSSKTEATEVDQDDERGKLKETCSGFGRKALGYLHPMNIVNLFTVFNLIASYDFKNTFTADLVSGFTIGFMHIPGALAYGAVTSLNPVNGLYTAFFPGVIYVLLGTSKHLSVGAGGITSIMIYSAVSRLENELAPALTKTVLSALGNQTQNARPSDDDISLSMYLSTDTDDSSRISQSLKVLVNENSDNVLLEDENELMSLKIKIAAALAFWCGIIQLTLAIFKVGNITKYFSLALLRGFTTASSLHTISVQLQNIFGIYYSDRKQRTFLKLFYRLLMLFERIKAINFVALGISVVSIATLLAFKLKINDRFKKQLRGIPIPVELILIMVSIGVTRLAGLHTNYDLAVVGHIPEGLPSSQTPQFNMFADIFQDALVISVVSFSTSFSVANILANKHKYRVDPNKEMFALGMGNIVGSFFQCFSCGGALARSALQESSGGRTQMVTVISCSIIAACLFYIAPFLEMLPKAILGSIIIASMYNLLKQLADLKHYWKIDKIEFLIWIITFGTSVMSDLGIGLLVGVIATLSLNTYRTQNLKLDVLGQVKDSDLFSNVEKYSTNQFEDIRIVRPTHSIFYINCDKFRNDMYDLCPLKDRVVDQTLCQECFKNYGCVLCCIKKPAVDDDDDKKGEVKLKLEQDPNNTDASLVSRAAGPDSSVKHYRAIVLDCTQVQFIDETTVKTLKEIINEYKKEKVKFFMTNCSDEVLKFLRKTKNYPEPFGEIIYLKNQDAVAAAASRQ